MISTEEAIKAVCDRIAKMLIDKNKAYGDSATNPVRIFSKADRIEQIKVRIDDKLSRLARGSDEAMIKTNEVRRDTVMDLIGYLILLVIAEDDK